MSNYPKMHVSLYVNDIKSTTTFYDIFFGKPAEKVKKDYAKYILQSPPLIISFVENPERVRSNFGHLGFQVETREALDRWLTTAKNRALPIREEMGTSCCYAVQDKFWVEDPDGNQWEVYYFHEDAEFNDPHYATGESNACCMPAPKEKKRIRLSSIRK